MSESTISASATALPRRRKGRCDPPTLHVYDRRKIMSRAWELAREVRYDAARAAHDASVCVVAGKITHAKPYAAFLAETPLDLSAAMKQAWAEVKQADTPKSPHNTALVVLHTGSALAPLRRRGLSRVLPLLITAARWIGGRISQAIAA